MKITLIDRLTNSKLYKLKKGLYNYILIYHRYVVSKYKNDPDYNITLSDFYTVFDIVSENCYKDYVDTKFKGLLDLDIDLLIKRRIFSVANYYILHNTYKGIIARDLMTVIKDFDLKDEYKNDSINIKINEIDFSCPYP